MTNLSLHRRSAAAMALAATLVVGCDAPDPAPVDVVEATISGIHESIFSGETTCRMVVQAYLDRIEAYEDRINAITVVNPAALDRADELDAALAAGEEPGQLFCVPMLVKDNFDTHDLITTAARSRWPRACRPTTPSWCAASARKVPSWSPRRTWLNGPSARANRSVRRSTRPATPTRSTACRRGRVGARPRALRRVSALSGWAATPATQSGDRRRASRWWVSARRSGSPAGTAWSPSPSTATSPGRWAARSRMWRASSMW